MTKMTRADKLAALVAKQTELRTHIADADRIVTAIGGARDKLEEGQNTQNYATQEFSGQVSIVKERQQWLITRMKELETDIRKLQKELGIPPGNNDSHH